ncbi:hypothetical protein D3790_14060 [Xenorhabdus nematophila]|nr:hypothetical protein D3790_14060 [Xenorhabdus nematophila]
MEMLLWKRSPCNEKFVSKLVRLGGFHDNWFKKCSFKNKIKENYCQRRKTPYNAPPLTNAELRHAAEDSRRDSENKRLTPEAKSVRYAASQPGRRFPVARSLTS